MKVEPLKQHTGSVLYDSVQEVLARVAGHVEQKPVSTQVVVVTTHIDAAGHVVIAVDGNSSYMQRLGLLTAAIAQTQKDMGF